MINIQRNHTHEKTLYDILVERGIVIDHHESDLYVLDTPYARQVIGNYEDSTHHTLTKKFFRSEVDGHFWWELPFMYSPFWRKR